MDSVVLRHVPTRVPLAGMVKTYVTRKTSIQVGEVSILMLSCCSSGYPFLSCPPCPFLRVRCVLFWKLASSEAFINHNHRHRQSTSTQLRGRCIQIVVAKLERSYLAILEHWPHCWPCASAYEAKGRRTIMFQIQAVLKQ